MTPPPAATAGGRLTSRPGSRIPRRASGPARPSAARAIAGGLSLPRPIDLHVPRPSARGLADAASRASGLLRGRGMIVVLAGALLGLVFLQVSLLKLNTQISQNAQRAQALERGNAGKRAVISKLDAGRRIQDVAGQLGMVMPGAGAVCYLQARGAGACSGGDPAAAMSAVDPATDTAPALPAADSATTTEAVQAAPVSQPETTVAPATTAPQAAAPPAPAPAPVATPAPEPAAAPTDPSVVATGGTAASAGG